jgi:DHA2 family multidrug resistance protein
MAKGGVALPRSAAGPYNPWLIAAIISIASFMEILDTTIANVALRHIAGGLAAGLDESTWILTSYLISNAVILPVSGWLSNMIGRKRFYMGCVAVFTVSSLMCALSTSLSEIIFFRVLQGAGGGGLAPTEQSMLADSFPPEKRTQAFALYALTVVVAPTIGPVIGGYLTDDLSWHWIFLINVPFGLLSLLLVWIFVCEPEALKEDRRKLIEGGLVVDWLGFLLVAVGLGALQVILDRGEIDDFFAAPSITFLTILFVVCIGALIPWEWHHPQPAVDVRLFKNRSYAATNLAMLLFGFILISTTQLLPQLTQQLMGYDATTAGLTLALGGFAALFVVPIAGLSSRLIQPKYLIIFGFVGESIALFNLTTVDLQMSFWSVAWARVLQAVFLPFLFVSLTGASYIGVPPDKTNEASATINLMRNLGGSMGVSAATTLLAWQTQFHHARLGESVSLLSRHFQDFEHQTKLHGMTALRSIASALQGQATVESYLDIFWLWGLGAALVWPIAFLIGRVPKGAAARGV